VTIPIWRRFAIALVTLALAAGLFHGQVAAALITRGDDALRNGDRNGAVRYYRRALTLDARSRTAADRLAFYLDIRRLPGDAQTAIDIATTALAGSPDDPALLADRGLAEQRLHRWAAAQAEFARAGEVGRDARYDHFAARIALLRGRPDEAKHFFRLALARDAHFDPARAALAALR